jgi:hypothetical protein
MSPEAILLVSLLATLTSITYREWRSRALRHSCSWSRQSGYLPIVLEWLGPRQLQAFRCIAEGWQGGLLPDLRCAQCERQI